MPGSAHQTAGRRTAKRFTLLVATAPGPRFVMPSGSASRAGPVCAFFYVADVEASGALLNGELHVALDDAEFLAVLPDERGASRPHHRHCSDPSGSAKDRQMSWQDLDPALMRRLGITVERVNWFSTYHVHHRVAEAFGKGARFSCWRRRPHP